MAYCGYTGDMDHRVTAETKWTWIATGYRINDFQWWWDTQWFPSIKYASSMWKRFKSQ